MDKRKPNDPVLERLRVDDAGAVVGRMVHVFIAPPVWPSGVLYGTFFPSDFEEAARLRRVKLKERPAQCEGHPLKNPDLMSHSLFQGDLMLLGFDCRVVDHTEDSYLVEYNYLFQHYNNKEPVCYQVRWNGEKMIEPKWNWGAGAWFAAGGA